MKDIYIWFRCSFCLFAYIKPELKYYNKTISIERVFFLLTFVYWSYNITLYSKYKCLEE